MTHDITDEMVRDILVAAFEGGINYWCREVEVPVWPDEAAWASDVPTLGGTLRLHTWDGTKRQLNAVRIRSGIRKAARHFGQTPKAFYDNHDAGAADIAVQFAVFNELVYG